MLFLITLIASTAPDCVAEFGVGGSVAVECEIVEFKSDLGARVIVGGKNHTIV